ncbi:iron chelate uptake ABC transporter family permease subunit [Agrobacterium sp. S2]|nr:iron chelate uptake ABC transporter family permease subunit [Agrobacterium sp. S2]
MISRKVIGHPAVPAVLVVLVAVVLAFRNIVGLLPDGQGIGTILFPDHDVTAQMLLHYTMLPRIAVALMAGAALGLAGALLQRILRNPLAEPATLGISAGAHLAMTLATLYFPAVLTIGREWTAFAGSSLALLAIIALSWGKRCRL